MEQEHSNLNKLKLFSFNVYECHWAILIRTIKVKSLRQGCPIFATEGRVYAGFHSNLSLHLLMC